MKIQDTQTNVLINNTAKKLKEIKEITKPEWANFVKTSRAR